MKLGIATLAALSMADPVSEPLALANTNARSSMLEIATGARSDGNALLIQQMLEFYLTVVHEVPANKVEMMLSYGCYCQLLTTRRIGLGEPVDEFDAICQKYQQCTQCVKFDQTGKDIDNGDGPTECNWGNGRYEISFVQGSERVDCTSNKGDCAVDLCTCDEELAFELAANQDKFNAKMSSKRGFEFADECIAQPPKGNGGGVRGEFQCCGTYPNRVPYHDKAGVRECCENTHVFSPKDKQCCGNGNVVALDGSC